MQSCKGCRFFLSDIDDEKSDFGICRRFPPSIKVKHIERDCQPVVVKSDWCAEWQAKSDSSLLISVDKLKLFARAKACMHKLNIKTLGDLIGKSADDLLEVKGTGECAIREIREKLAAVGLKLKGD